VLRENGLGQEEKDAGPEKDRHDQSELLAETSCRGSLSGEAMEHQFWHGLHTLKKGGILCPMSSLKKKGPCVDY